MISNQELTALPHRLDGGRFDTRVRSHSIAILRIGDPLVPAEAIRVLYLHNGALEEVGEYALLNRPLLPLKTAIGEYAGVFVWTPAHSSLPPRMRRPPFASSAAPPPPRVRPPPSAPIALFFAM